MQASSTSFKFIFLTFVCLTGFFVSLSEGVQAQIRAQESGQDLNIPEAHFEHASEQFKAAFKAEFGKEPSEKQISKALAQYKQSLANMPTLLGRSAGRDARLTANLNRSIEEHTGASFIELIDTQRINSIDELKKSVVSTLVKMEQPNGKIDGRKLILDPTVILKLKENTEIVFPEGTFSIDERKLMRIVEMAGQKLPAGLAFVGAGKDKTTLKIGDMGLTRGDVERLCFRNMTIDCQNDGLTDKRQGCLSLKLANVRVVRFDAGHGGCDIFSVRMGLIVHATDTEFVGGLGRSPGNGNVFDCRRILLGHFERCQFTGINYPIFRNLARRTNKVWMDNCRFDREYRGKQHAELKDCEFNVVLPRINWAPSKDTKVEKNFDIT